MRQNFRAVLFDLDGTLLDTLVDLANATNFALAALGCPTHPSEAYRYFVGDGARNLCLRTLPSGREDLVDEAVKLMRQHYEEHCCDETRIYPGIVASVSSLAKRGFAMAVLSNKPDDFTRRMVAHYFGHLHSRELAGGNNRIATERPVSAIGPFDIVRGQQAGVPIKPNPSTAICIAKQLAVPASEWLYLGDTNTDMLTARNAGMFPVGVLWGFRDRQELIEAGARELIARPDELLTFLA